jgi:tetratricopeptide (TPR) repeat protein
MTVIVRMAQGALDLARHRLDNGLVADGLRCLERLVDLPGLPSSTRARAHFLIAKTQLEWGQFECAQEHMEAAVQLEPASAEYHFHLARCYESDENASPKLALRHFRWAHQLDSSDKKKQTALGLHLVRSGNAGAGLRLLERAYCDCGTDPEVVRGFLEALFIAGRFADAELVLKQVVYRKPDCQQFDALVGEFRARLVSVAPEIWLRSAGADERMILPFRNFSRPEPVDDSPPSVILDESMELDEVLRRFGKEYWERVFDNLELNGVSPASRRRAAIVRTLLDSQALRRVVKRLSIHARRLLRNAVRVGGCLPTGALLQNTGPEAPPADYARPLIQLGLMYVGRLPQRRSKGIVQVAIIPADLRQQLAESLFVRN